MFEDRRKYPRHKDFVRLRITTDRGDRNFVTTDVCATGAFFAAAEAPEPGTLLTVVMRPEGMKVAPIEVEAIVVRTVAPGMPHQPGFAVRWAVARSDAGGEPLYRVLKRILRVPEVSIEMFGHEREVEFVFPDAAEDFGKVLQIDNAPRGPLLQQRREEKRTGPPKAPPPVRAPLEKLPKVSENATDSPMQIAPKAPKVPKRRKSGTFGSARPSGSATARSKTFSSDGRSRRTMPQTDDIMVGAAALKHRDSDVTQVGGRSRSLTARRQSGADAPQDVTIMDDIRVAALSAVGKTRTERLVEKARENHEAKANVGERSQIFGKSARLSSLGGRSMSTTIRGGADDEIEHTSVTVDLPITYELDNRFVPARLIQVAPLALEVIAEGATPQLDQNLTINMPVPVDGIYRTINLMGKLLRLPEQKDDGMSFVFHIERVHEGDHTGAFTNFIASRQKQAAPAE